MDETELPGEGEFEDVHDQEEPRACSDEVLFWERKGEEINGHDWARCVCEHGDAACPDTHGPSEGTCVWYGGTELREGASDGL